MRILSWNINGLRAAGRESSVEKLITSLEADIVCLQETKVSRDQLDEPTAIIEGFVSFFSFCKTKKQGYSGVATFAKLPCCPVFAEQGVTGCLAAGQSDTIGCYGETDLFQVDSTGLDQEGRTVMTEHKLQTGKSLVIINVYCPRASVCEDGGKRMEYKMQFHRILSERCRGLVEAGKHVLLLGDMNAIHESIDCCEPDMMTFDSSFGQTWMADLIRINPSEGPGLLVDCFRQFHATRKNAFTCWATVTSARETNYGRRLDYILASPDFFLEHVTASDISPHIQGSDHCPVVVDINVSFCPADKPPSLCSQFLPEFSGRQQKLTSFLTSRATMETKSRTTVEASKSTSPSESDSRKRKNSVIVVGTKRTKQESQTKLARFLTKMAGDDKSETPETDKAAKGVETIDDQSDVKLLKSVSTDSRLLQANQWKSLFKGPAPLPLCKGHNEPCVLRTVRKTGRNQHRQFYVCARPQGLSTDPKARCDHFEWASGIKVKSL